MSLEKLYYFHAFLNHKFFNGKLEAVIIKTFDDSDDEMLAKIETELDPFIIFIGNFSIEGDPVFLITVLLHEMIHQYNRQRGIEDVDCDTGKHNASFKRAARNHGLEMGGYRLTDEAMELISKQLKHYDHVVENYNEPYI